MPLSGALRELSVVVGGFETSGYTVEDVRWPSESAASGETLSVELDLSVPIEEQVGAETCADVSVTDPHRTRDGSVPMTVEVDVSLEEASDCPGRIPAPAGEQTVPRYKDPSALAEVYEAYETFEEMTEALDVEVSPSTVRRHMIKHGVHEPEEMPDRNEDATDPQESPADHEESRSDASENATPEQAASARDAESSDGDSLDIEAAQVVTDGIGLPEDLTIEDVAEIVVSSSTLYEVRTKMDLDHDRARRLLGALNLLDLVTGRLSEKSTREVTRDQIRERIHAAG